MDGVGKISRMDTIGSSHKLDTTIQWIKNVWM